MTWKNFVAVLILSTSSLSFTQQPVEKPAVETHDAELDMASEMVGRALFLRCFCAENNLTFDEHGQVTASGARKTDWTVSGVNVQKVSRKSPEEIELDGVRVAIRYATDRHEFDRKPQNDSTMHLLIMVNGDAAAFQHALDAIFSTGIDRELQLSMPEAWQHYFNPGLKWPDDTLTGQSVMSVPASTADATVATVTHRADAGYTAVAAHDHVAGSVKLRFVVDAEGVPQRIAIVVPLGYGLDAKAVEAVAKYRFKPATYQEKAVASNVTLDEEFKVVQVPQ